MQLLLYADLSFLQALCGQQVSQPRNMSLRCCFHLACCICIGPIPAEDSGRGSSFLHHPHTPSTPTTPSHFYTFTLSHRQALVLLLAEDSDSLALAAWQACDALAATIPKDEQAGHTAALKEALAGAREKERRKRRPGALQLHGLLLHPKALGPFVPIYLQGVLQVQMHGRGRRVGTGHAHNV